MDSITIRNYVSNHAARLAEVQARCLAVCPDTSCFPPRFWQAPGFENGKNIFCAFDGQENLLGYAAVSPSYISRHLGARILWLDLRVDPMRVDGRAIKEMLYGKVLLRARQLAHENSHERAALSATYFAEGETSIDYLRSKGFTPYQTCYAMRRDLAQPLPDLDLPAGVLVRSWRLETEKQQRAYLEAYDAAFEDEGKNLDDLRHFLKSEQWSVGTAFMALHGDCVLGSVAAWYHPRSKGAGKTEVVFVIPRWRRQGIARYLLVEGMRYLRDRGLAYAVLEMDGANAPALALYESLGYRICKEEMSLGLALETKPNGRYPEESRMRYDLVSRFEGVTQS